ncbi:hypothetical protein GCM10027578_40840 [Spirosoma luteolum]
MTTFSKEVGRFLKADESNAMTGAYRERKSKMGINEDECVRSEFFGLDQVMHLLSQPGCTGLRVHHAKRWEDLDGNPTDTGVGQLRPRVLLTGVGPNGRDMHIPAAQAGLKDTPPADDDGEATTLGDGFTCPQHCPK